jgi:HEAT repeat protein
MLERNDLDLRMIVIELLGEEGDQRALKALRYAYE